MNLKAPTMNQQQLKVHLLNKYRIVTFTVAKAQFNMLLRGDTDITLKRPHDWIGKRFYYPNGLVKDWDYILFINGIGQSPESLIYEYIGIKKLYQIKVRNWFEPMEVIRATNSFYKLFLGDNVCDSSRSKRQELQLVYPKRP